MTVPPSVSWFEARTANTSVPHWGTTVRATTQLATEHRFDLGPVPVHKTCDGTLSNTADEHRIGLWASPVRHRMASPSTDEQEDDLRNSIATKSRCCPGDFLLRTNMLIWCSLGCWS